jgi:L,D-peptidoglycan transpeptidase YkuD (ErfK/YbiS/YcfS/YnhG family)
MTVRLRSVGIGMTLAAGVMQSCQPACAPTPPAAVCAPPAGVPAAARQVVVVTASGSRADVDLLVHDGTAWQCAAMDMPGRVGSNGVRELSARRSGDGTTPGGVFGLGTMTAPNRDTFQFFGNGGNPGVRGGWHQVQPNDCWGATPGSPDYNVLVSRPDSTCNSPDEYLPNIIGPYSQAALIDANMGPARSGDDPSEPPLAAAIFLHRHSFDGNGNSRPTSGCVSLNAGNLATVLTRLVPGEAWFVIR